MAVTLSEGRSAPAPIDDFARTLARRGVPAALALLNAGVAHRYTALYRLDGARLHSLYFHDRAGEPRPDFLAVIDMGQSYCQYVLRDGAFLTDNSAFDSRLDGHPYQGVIVAYHGIPVHGPRGALLGTLCHFDTEPRGLMSAQFDLLQQAVLRLRSWMYPGAAAETPRPCAGAAVRQAAGEAPAVANAGPETIPSHGQHRIHPQGGDCPRRAQGSPVGNREPQESQRPAAQRHCRPAA